jgi:hypothetical protein
LTRLEARQTLLKEKKEALFPRMKRAKILVAILIVSSVVIVHAGNQSSPAAPMQVCRNVHRKAQMSAQNRSDIRDQVLDNLREILKQSAPSSAREMRSGCGGMATY